MSLTPNQLFELTLFGIIFFALYAAVGFWMVFIVGIIILCVALRQPGYVSYGEDTTKNKVKEGSFIEINQKP